MNSFLALATIIISYFLLEVLRMQNHPLIVTLGRCDSLKNYLWLDLIRGCSGSSLATNCLDSLAPKTNQQKELVLLLMGCSIYPVDRLIRLTISASFDLRSFKAWLAFCIMLPCGPPTICWCTASGPRQISNFHFRLFSWE